MTPLEEHEIANKIEFCGLKLAEAAQVICMANDLDPASGCSALMIGMVAILRDMKKQDEGRMDNMTLIGRSLLVGLAENMRRDGFDIPDFSHLFDKEKMKLIESGHYAAGSA